MGLLLRRLTCVMDMRSVLISPGMGGFIYFYKISYDGYLLCHRLRLHLGSNAIYKHVIREQFSRQDHLRYNPKNELGQRCQLQGAVLNKAKGNRLGKLCLRCWKRPSLLGKKCCSNSSLPGAPTNGKGKACHLLILRAQQRPSIPLLTKL